jgi:hypothetical protein
MLSIRHQFRNVNFGILYYSYREDILSEGKLLTDFILQFVFTKYHYIMDEFDPQSIQNEDTNLFSVSVKNTA